jgi:hypothetical protein
MPYRDTYDVRFPFCVRGFRHVGHWLRIDDDPIMDHEDEIVIPCRMVQVANRFLVIATQNGVEGVHKKRIALLLAALGESKTSSDRKLGLMRTTHASLRCFLRFLAAVVRPLQKAIASSRTMSKCLRAQFSGPVLPGFTLPEGVSNSLLVRRSWSSSHIRRRSPCSIMTYAV